MPNTRAIKNRPQLQPVDIEKPVNAKPLTSEKSQRMDHATLKDRPAMKSAKPKPKEPRKDVQKYTH